MIVIIIYDFEVFKHNWLICWLDTKTRKKYKLWDDPVKFKQFYDHYKDEVWVGYNSRGYDQWIAKSILCGFDPYKMSEWIIIKDQKGFMFSKLLNNFPIINYDCSPPFHSLKQLEAFMGHDICETSVPFDIDRPLTEEEKKETEKYCFHDVMETFEVFVRTKDEWESHVGLVKEFGLPATALSKTKAQISAIILGAEKRTWNDEFDIKFPDTLDLGRYEFLKDKYLDWAKNSQEYKEMSFETDLNGVTHTFGVGGIHGAIENYYGEGYYLMADVGSFYPAIMIEYNFLSRNVRNPKKYRQIRDERIEMKRNKDPRQQPRKIVLNSTFGASKDQYNALYDPQMANNVCIAGQLLLADLLDKLYGKCELIQSNTDGILVKLYNKEDRQPIIDICEDWCKRTRMEMEYDDYVKVIQSDVNNYIIIPEGELFDSKGKERFKRKGRVAKQQHDLDYDMPIINDALVNYYVFGISPQETIFGCNDLRKFQKVTKITNKFEYAFHGFHTPIKAWSDHDFCEYEKLGLSKNGTILKEKVIRCFASLNKKDGTLYKKSKTTTTLSKTTDTPEHCFIDNTNILEKKIPETLDKQWYLDYAYRKINAFLGK